jgi:hypothetical protein
VGRRRFRITAAEALANSAAGAKQANSNGSFRPALLFGNFLYFEAFQVMTLQNHPVVVFTGLQDSPDVNRG